MENPSRRRVLTAGLTGAAATLLASQRVSATTPPDSTTPSSEAPAPTDPPARPTEADVALLAFAQQAELAARDLYQDALDAGAAGNSDRVLQACRDNHGAAANVLSGMLGTSAPQARDEDVYSERSGDFSSTDLGTVAAAGYDLENTLVATHISLVGMLEGVDGARDVAAILAAEARMCTVLADLSGNGDDLAALFDNTARGLTPPATQEG